MAENAYYISSWDAHRDSSKARSQQDHWDAHRGGSKTRSQQVYDNAGYQSAGSMGSLRSGQKYSLESQDRSRGRGHGRGQGRGDETFRKNAGRSRCCIAVIIIGVIILLAIGVGLGLYFGVFADKSDSAGRNATDSVTASTTTVGAQTTESTSIPDTGSTTTASTVSQTTAESTSSPTVTTTAGLQSTGSTSPPVTEVSFDVTLTLDQPFDPELNDPNSPTYINLKTDIENMNNEIMEDSDISEAFIRGTVTGFSDGSILATSRLEFKSSQVLDGNKVIAVNAVKITDVIKAGLTSKPDHVQLLKIDILQTIVYKHLELHLGEEGCQRPLDCMTPDTTCLDNVCSCLTTHFHKDTGCLMRKGLKDWCNSDLECQPMFRCHNNSCQCPSGSHPEGQVCVEDPPSCHEPETVAPAAMDCVVNLQTLDDDLRNYTCMDWVTKLKCMVRNINEARHYVFHCNSTELKDMLFDRYIRTEFLVPFNLHNCSEFSATLRHYAQIPCANDTVPADIEDNHIRNKLPVLFADYEYEYTGTRCHIYSSSSYDTDFDVTVWSDSSYEKIYENLFDILSNDPIFGMDTAYVMLHAVSLDIDYCEFMPTLVQLGTECMRNILEWFVYDGWETCRPIYDFTRCIRRHFTVEDSEGCYTNMLVDNLFNNAMVKEQFITEVASKVSSEELTSDMDTNGARLHLLEVVSRYSLEVCPDFQTENNPCNVQQTKNEIVQNCLGKYFTESINLDHTQGNYGISPANCRDFYYTVSCVKDDFSKLGTQCWDLEQLVYDTLKSQYDTNNILPDSYSSLYFCNAYQPVCTSVFIKNSKNRCKWNHPLLYCRSEDDLKKATSYVTCIRLIALSKNQDDCTTLSIKEIIKNDNFKLDIMNRYANIDQCLPDDAIDGILPTRESVCTSGIPVTFFEDLCVQHKHSDIVSQNETNYENRINPLKQASCTTTANGIIQSGHTDLGCRLYLGQMDCIHAILTNMSFSCSMDQLVNSPVPVSSPMYLQHAGDQCLDIYSNDGYKNCDLSLSQSQYIGQCSTFLTYTPFLSSNKTQDIMCRLYTETLGCYDVIAQNQGFTCSLDQLRTFLLDITKLAYYAWRPLTKCEDSPQESPYLNCQAILPQGNICENTERLAYLLMELCGDAMSQLMKAQINTSQPIDQTVMNCYILESIINCGSNITSLMGHNCAKDHLVLALIEHKDIVDAVIPGFDVADCQDSCYRTTDGINTCLQPYLYSAMYSMDSCRVFTYIWQCLDTTLRHNDGSQCGNLIINSIMTIALGSRYSMSNYFTNCSDPASNPLDICQNITDIALLGGYTCTNPLYGMRGTNCSAADEARQCYQNIISVFAGSCSDESLSEKAMVVGGFSSYNDVSQCVAEKYTREGFCPFAQCYSSNRNMEECILDTECDGSLKCCFSGCNTTCKSPLSKPSRWQVAIRLTNETFTSGMDIQDSSEYNSFIQKYSYLTTMLFQQFHTYTIIWLREDRGVVIHAYVWSAFNPWTPIYDALNIYFTTEMENIELYTVFRDEEQRDGVCPSSEELDRNGVCGLQVCEFDNECASETAKCCYTSCFNSYPSQRCIDLNEGQKPSKNFDCLAILNNGLSHGDGIYEVQLNGTKENISVVCDMTTDGGGWTVFQRRLDSSIDFYRNFSDYENGFGPLDGTFWLGLKYVYNMTADIKSFMRLDMTNHFDKHEYELIEGFRLTDPPLYKLFIDGYSVSYRDPGTFVVGLGYYNGYSFSTYDNDHSGYDCTATCHGGGWYAACCDANPNGEYITPGDVWSDPNYQFNPGYGGMIYHDWMKFKSLKTTKMMFRRA